MTTGLSVDAAILLAGWWWWSGIAPEGRVRAAETAVALTRQPAAHLEGIEAAILLDGAAADVLLDAPAALIARSEGAAANDALALEELRRSRTGAETDRCGDGQSGDQGWEAHEYSIHSQGRRIANDKEGESKAFKSLPTSS